MTCNHPECTGVHETSRKYSERCPRTIARCIERELDRYYGLHGAKLAKRRLLDRRWKAMSRMRKRMEQNG